VTPWLTTIFLYEQDSGASLPHSEAEHRNNRQREFFIADLFSACVLEETRPKYSVNSHIPLLRVAA
jgi:hypothetical protein